MPDHKKRFESMLFNYESTIRTDFRDGEIEPIITTKYQGKGASCLRVRPRPLKDVHALTDWHTPNVPFDLFGKPKECVRTNPNEVQKRFGRVEDFERKLVQATRPRVCIVPAVSLDDVEDRARKILVDNMYITSSGEAMRDGLADIVYKNVKAPIPEKAAPANPITIERFLPPPVPTEWRMDSVTWDNRQLRSYCDSTKEFWLARTPNCKECLDTAARDAVKRMKQKY